MRVTPIDSNAQRTPFGRVCVLPPKVTSGITDLVVGGIEKIGQSVADVLSLSRKSVSAVIPDALRAQQQAERAFKEILENGNIEDILRRNPYIYETVKGAGGKIEIVPDAFSMLLSHKSGVDNFATGVMRHLGLEREHIKIMSDTAFTHDFGKAVSSIWEVVTSPNGMTAEWRKLMDTHAGISELMLQDISYISPEVRKIISLHHSKVSEISKLGDPKLIEMTNIFKTCDIWEALTTLFDPTRLYRKPFAKCDAAEIMRKNVKGDILSKDAVDSLFGFVFNKNKDFTMEKAYKVVMDDIEQGVIKREGITPELFESYAKRLYAAVLDIPLEGVQSSMYPRLLVTA